ncbi:MAG: hypothetical protein CSA26_06050 [Desulfobacterales bacterium]|nr:MAG: hypothetical protein CSA26_06050 [Desulfobacterales bacterium]
MHIITTHKNTDFDGLASVIAATLLYPGSIGVIPRAVNNNVSKFLSTHKTAFSLVLPNEINLDDVHQLTIVDTDQWRRLDLVDKLRDRHDIAIALWDHHNGGGDIKADWVCQEVVGATVTLLVREMKRRRIDLNPLISTILLIGLYEDTGHLSFPSTTPEDARAAAYLLENGADLNVASVFLNPPYEKAQRDVLFEMMQNTEKIKLNNYTIGLNIIQLDKKIPMLASVVSMYRNIINVDAVFVICINDEKSSTVIGRSGVDRIDVGKILGQFGGGGHPAAGSATVKSSLYQPVDLKKRIIDTIEKNKASGAVISDLMSFPVTFVSPDTPMSRVREIMQEKKIRGVLVGDEFDLQGIIVIWDFKKLKLEKQWKSPVKAFMARNVATTKPGLPPAEVAKFMAQNDIGYLPVKHKGKIIGIVSRTDIICYFYGLLPE